MERLHGLVMLEDLAPYPSHVLLFQPMVVVRWRIKLHECIDILFFSADSARSNDATNPLTTGWPSKRPWPGDRACKINDYHHGVSF